MTYRFLSVKRLGATAGVLLLWPALVLKLGNRALERVAKNVALKRFWPNCVRDAQNKAAQKRTWRGLARRIASWRSPLGAKIGCPCSSCLKTHYKSDTLDLECVKMHYKVVSCFLESLKTHYEVYASFANVHKHILKLRDTARVQGWLVRWLLFYSVSARRKYDLM